VRILALVVLLGSGLTLGTGTASAAVVATVPLGTAAAYGVLGAQTVTNTGPTVVKGLDVGVSPKTEITGFGPGIITPPGVKHAADANAASAQAAALTAFNNAAGRVPAPADKGLTDLTLVKGPLQPGVYQGNLSLSKTVTLDNRTNPDAVFIFQASSKLTIASGSAVRFTTDHVSCNVFWEVGSSATIFTGSRFVGTVLAHTSIAAQTGATITGRLLANTGAVTLDTNTITAPSCAATTPVTSTGKPTPTSRTAVVPPPVTTIPPPRDVTSGSSASIIAPTTPSQAGSTRTSTPNTTNNSNSGGRHTPNQQTSTLQVTETTSTRPGLAVTGPPPIGGLMVVGLTSILAGGMFLGFSRARRIQRGRHHRPAH
jgi:hypothetical protein